MIQLGTLGNFFHAIWLEKISGSLKLENKCFIGEDNVIAVGKDLKKDLEAAVALNPDIVIAGPHGCKVNCSECCDRPAYKNRVVRRYCEYLTEVGNYCIPKLAGKKGTDDVCEKWFCRDFCEDPVDRFSGNSLEVPLIGSTVAAYAPQQKHEFMAIVYGLYGILSSDGELEQLPLFSARGREVRLYKTAKRELLKTADGKAAALIEDDKFSEAEALMGSNKYFEVLKQWEGMYCRRKGLEL